MSGLHVNPICFITATSAGIFAATVLAAAPELESIAPRGAQRGQPAILHFHGARLGDVQEIIVYPTADAVDGGFDFTSLRVLDDGHVEAAVYISPNCSLGEHAMRVRTATGISTMRTFWVGQYPGVDEVEPNSTFESPQVIEMNVTVAGMIENEDVDHYLVKAKKGRRLSVEIEGIRLGEKMFDPYVAILDRRRFKLSTSDDTTLLLQDSIAAVVVPEDGPYIIQVREASYGGGGCRYRLHIGHFPRPLVTYPAGGPAGESIEVQLLGDVAGPYMHTVELPVEKVSGFSLFAPKDGLLPPSPNLLRVSSFPNVLEVEPNNTHAGATESELGLPLALNGIVQEAGDIDWYRVRGTKGQKFNVRVHATSVRSPLDSVLAIHRTDGQRIAYNDDAYGLDSAVGFTVPGDGYYLVGVHDHLHGGGKTYIYRVEFDPIIPAVESYIPRFGRNSQARQVVTVPRGNRSATLLNGKRENFDGPLVFEAENLPEGVTLHGQTMPPGLSQMPFVFEAIEKAPIGGGLVNMLVRHAVVTKNIRGTFKNDVELVTAGNNEVYYQRRLCGLPVVVGQAVPYTIELVAPTVPLVQHGAMNLRVIAHRAEGFTKPILLRLLWKPPGVNAQTTIQLPEGETEVDYPLTATGGAQATTWQIVVLGEADPGHGQVIVSSALTPLTVASPYVGMTIDMTALERGQVGEIICTLEQHKPFEGEAVVRLLGLPHQVTTETRRVTKDDTQIVFPITTGAGSPVGIHKNLFCELVLREQTADIIHHVGHGGKLRIDSPPPPVAGVAPEPPPKPTAKPPAEKRLTRLEQLRMQAKNRAAATGSVQ